MIQTMESLEEWCERISRADYVAFDTETDSLNYMQANIVGLSFAVAPGSGGLSAGRPHRSGCAGATGQA